MNTKMMARTAPPLAVLMLLAACGGGGGGGGSSGGGSGGSNNPPPAQSYTVTASAGTGGTISPASTNVASGGSTTFTVTANTGYEIGEVTGCAGSLSGSTYTTGSITAACTVNATFRLKKYTVTATAGTGGSISPASASVDHGTTTAFTVTPNTGYDIAEVTGCSGSLSGSTYTTGSITAACTVNATFRLKKYTVTATAGTGGSISPASASVDHGTTTTFTVTPQSDFVISSVTGCSGSLNGSTYTTGAVTAACSVSASFLKKVATTAIAGVWTGTDTSRPAYITVTSESDDSFLKVVPIAADGSFTVTGLDATRKYIVEPEQSGTRVSTSSRVNTQSSTDADERVANTAVVTTSAAFVTASPGEYLTFNGTKIPGLSESEFVYRWEGNDTASGAEHSSYIPNPLKVEILGNENPAADPQAATRLAEEYGIVLVNPEPNSTSDQMFWTSEYAERLLKMIQVTPLPASSQGSRGWAAPTRVLLFNREIPADIEKTTSSYMGGTVRISASAFVYAAPLVARIEGRRGFFFSNRLFRAVIRMVTEDGARINLVREMMKQRYGITIASDENNPLLFSPSATCPRFPSDCTQGEWRLFKPDELFDLLAISEEFPEGLRDFSQPGKAIGLRNVLRRRDGVPHPLYPEAGAVAWPDLGYAEYMEKGLIGTQKTRHALYAHEKAHFLWAGLLSERLRLDWMRLSGWYRVPTLVPGQDVKVIGKCDDWQKDSKTWSPPNVTAEDSAFKGPVKHDDAYSDAASVKEYWGSCSTTQFVSTYAAQTNPNEDFAESFATFLLNPDLLRSRALPKYEFIRDRLMQGSFYISKIREDLQFEVFNLYPDYTYPGKIKTVDVRVTGNANDDKLVTIRISLHTSVGCSSAKNSGCFEGASQADMRLYSRLSPPTFIDARLTPVTSAGDVLEGTVRISKYAAAGWWQVDTIAIRDNVGNERLSKQASRDFGWKLYVNNPLEDLTKPKIISSSVSMKLLLPGDPELAGLSGPKYQISGDEKILRVSYRVDDRNMVDGKSDCYAAISYADSLAQSAGVRIYKNTFDEYGAYRAFSSAQIDGATGICNIDQRVTKFWTNGTYYVPYVFVYDAALNIGEKRLSLRGADPTIEKAPEVTVQGSTSDDTPPVLDIGVCKGGDVAERCLRVSAAPTNPSSPNGETVVNVYYWAFETSPLSKSSGLNEGYLQLRDPTGKIFGYYLMEGAVGAVGVAGRSPKRWRDGNYSFMCPSDAPSPCDATTPVQYQARIVLPAGSAPGTWGLLSFAVGDKVENYRGYDFTETFRFTPSGSGDDERISATGSGETGNPFTFEVAGVGSKPPSLSEVVIATAQNALSGVVSAVGGWVSRAASWITDGISRAANWVQGGVRSGVNLVRTELGFATNAPASTRREGESRSNTNSAVRGGDVVSIAEDPLTGSRYQIVREEQSGSDRQQGWVLEYRSNTDTLFASKALPDTAEVLWRASRSPSALPTTAWTQVCADRVWSVQDGYQMLFHVGDRSLSDLRPGQLWVNSQSEVTVVEDVRCAFGGAVWVEGYAFGANDREPLLRGERVTASRFGFALDRFGAVSKREVTSTAFEAPKYCAEPANEQLMFCAAAKKAVGW